MDKVDEALSGQDIKNILGKDIPIYAYGDLADFDTLSQAWGPRQAMIILYETQKGNGHWTCVFENNGRICVFDSYAIIPDNELKYIDENFRQKSDQELPHLSHLMYDDGRPVEYNNHRLQKLDNSIATCGKHCIIRLLLRDLGVDAYAKLMRNIAKKNKLTVDELVSELYDMLRKS
jgi:hypothetical protein